VAEALEATRKHALEATDNTEHETYTHKKTSYKRGFPCLIEGLI